MAEFDQAAVERVAELFKTCRARHRESYPHSLLDFDLLDLTGKLTHGSWAHAKGHFADVYKGNMSDGAAVAVKMLRLPAYSLHNDDVYRTALLRFFREINIWSALDHPNVTPCLGYTLAGGNLSLISPWYDKGNLVQFLQTSRDASEPDLILDVAEGTQYLHTCSNPLIHGDLKGANILVSEHGVARLADFGISKQISDMNRSTGFTTTSGVAGTVPWMAPELDEDSPLTFPCDVYSCAGVFLEICCPGKTPYHYLKPRSLVLAKNAGTLPELAQYPEIAGKTALWEIMCECWAHDPLRRPSITRVVQSLYGLFMLSPRANQTVTFRPAKNPNASQGGSSAIKRPRPDSPEGNPRQNNLATGETRLKRQKRQKSASRPESPTGEKRILPTADLPPSSSSFISSSSSDPPSTDAPDGGLTMRQLMAMDPEDVLANHLKQGSDWYAISNPQVTRTLDISLLVTLAHKNTVRCVRFSPDGKYIAIACDSTAYVYDTTTGEKTHMLVDSNSKEETDSSDIKSITFSPDGKLVATGAYDYRVRIWDLAEHKIRTIFDGHTKDVMSVAFSPDGSKIVSGSLDMTCRIWDLQTGEAIVLTCVGAGTWKEYIQSVAFSPDGLLVAAGCSDRIVRIWNALTGDLAKNFEGHMFPIWSVAFTPDGMRLISGSGDNTVKCWDLEPLLESRSCNQEEGETVTKCVASVLGHKGPVYSVATSRDGSLVAAYDEGIVGFWDVTNLETPQFMLKGHDRPVYSVDLGPASTHDDLGGLLATGTDDDSTRIWRYRYA